MVLKKFLWFNKIPRTLILGLQVRARSQQVAVDVGVFQVPCDRIYTVTPHVGSMCKIDLSGNWQHTTHVRG